MALDDFIKKFEVRRGDKIDIPSEASSFTVKKRHIYFYRNGNGKYLLEKYFKLVSFPRFEASNHHVNYGEPVFE
ncbi:MAG: hypothetical protein Q8P15_03720 [Nanoarchaeota archaeon]|nr:hypothetical protein [Nanoarchaeota archaeon]